MKSVKLKWHYDKNFKQWYMLDSGPYESDVFTIDKDGSQYRLRQGHFKLIDYFEKLKNAKTVAELIRNG